LWGNAVADAQRHKQHIKGRQKKPGQHWSAEKKGKKEGIFVEIGCCLRLGMPIGKASKAIFE